MRKELKFQTRTIGYHLQRRFEPNMPLSARNGKSEVKAVFPLILNQFVVHIQDFIKGLYGLL